MTPEEKAAGLSYIAMELNAWASWSRNNSPRPVDENSVIIALPTPWWPGVEQIEKWRDLINDAAIAAGHHDARPFPDVFSATTAKAQ
jgi:hypothetical protein